MASEVGPEYPSCAKEVAFSSAVVPQLPLHNIGKGTASNAPMTSTKMVAEAIVKLRAYAAAWITEV
eukprot:414973-Amphidinium_carterae.3